MHTATILFTVSNSPMSWLIRKLTNEPASHCAILLDGFVLHSNLFGVTAQLLHTFKQKNQIVFSLDFELTTQQYEKLLSVKETSHYDFGALLYIGTKILMSKIGVRLPKINLWQSTGMFLCTEFITHIISPKENSMITPYQLYQNLRNDDGSIQR